MVRAPYDMSMVTCMKLIGWMMRGMARAPYDMTMVMCMKVIGRMI